MVRVGRLPSAQCGRGREGVLELDSSSLSNPSPEMGVSTLSTGSSPSQARLARLHPCCTGPCSQSFQCPHCLERVSPGQGEGIETPWKGPALPGLGIHNCFPSEWLHECPLGSHLPGGGCGCQAERDITASAIMAQLTILCCISTPLHLTSGGEASEDSMQLQTIPAKGRYPASMGCLAHT